MADVDAIEGLLGLLGGGAVWAAGACSGNRGLPRDLVPAEVTRAPVREGGAAELVWGGWHPVPRDTRAALVLDRAYRLQLQGEREDAILPVVIDAVADAVSALSDRDIDDDEQVSEAARRAVRRVLRQICGKRPHTEVHLVRV